MSPLALALAALIGALVGAPIWVLAWEYRAHALQHGRALATVVRVRVLRHRRHSRTVTPPRIRSAYTARHATPPGGTPVITPAQIREATPA